MSDENKGNIPKGFADVLANLSACGRELGQKNLKELWQRGIEA